MAPPSSNPRAIVQARLRSRRAVRMMETMTPHTIRAMTAV